VPCGCVGGCGGGCNSGGRGAWVGWVPRARPSTSQHLVPHYPTRICVSGRERPLGAHGVGVGGWGGGEVGAAAAGRPCTPRAPGIERWAGGRVDRRGSTWAGAEPQPPSPQPLHKPPPNPHPGPRTISAPSYPPSPTPLPPTHPHSILRMAFPIALTNMSGYSLLCLAESFIGRLGAASLSSSTLANSFYRWVKS
jgi:hypothetical protein